MYQMHNSIIFLFPIALSFGLLTISIADNNYFYIISNDDLWPFYCNNAYDCYESICQLSNIKTKNIKTFRPYDICPIMSYVSVHILDDDGICRPFNDSVPIMMHMLLTNTEHQPLYNYYCFDMAECSHIWCNKYNNDPSIKGIMQHAIC